MKSIYTLILLTMGAFSTGLWSQTPSAKTNGQFKTEPMPMPMNRQVNVNDHLHMLSQQLNLTKAQETRIKPILEHYLRERQQLELNNKISDDEKSARLQSGERASHSKIRAVLTPAQKKEFDDIMGTDDNRAQPPSKAQKKK